VVRLLEIQANEFKALSNVELHESFKK